MRVTGYRIIPTVLDWGRRIGDVNGVMPGDETASSIVLLDTDTDLVGVAVGQGSLIDTVFPAVEGEDPRSVNALYDRMLAWSFKAGNAGAVFGAIGTIDLALWDIKAKAAGEPLWRLLGGRDRTVRGYASGLDAGLDDDQLHSLYSGFAQAGFTAAKLKGGRNVADDLRRLEVVRDALGVDHPVLAIDSNESWNVKQAVRYVTALERSVDLAWVEEPVRRWDAEGLATVSRQVCAAVATGENLTGIDQYLPLITGRAVDLVQAGGGWGITHFLRVASLAAGHNLPVSPVGFFGHLAPAAAAVPNHALTEVQGFSLPAGVTADWDVDDGRIILGSTPGNGLSFDESAARPPAISGTPAPEGPHVRPADAGLRMTLHG
ncbi:mandelate racemase/muconate lactonizing enzyme family protein [Microlunatus sp. Gsoil 973]|uniref:mandelate racemase/muconate lactonizing enzyme family protein n=1 Tax=Microlunatus sp. Gsoil 973 TaxID=2672569 RepID=UPI0012B463D4|nr:mandelate racemase/muconate lactonizing enzyme family protein [Microlunatus sp. Gsoil 973]QGN32238.1 mandelate racemase/muconate lactonizing enzyme family protein [Microlunatus sp. Gsoil 973]